MLDKKADRPIIAFINKLPEIVVTSVRRYEKQTKQKFALLVLVDKHKHAEPPVIPGADIVLVCDYDQSLEIAETLLPYQERLIAMTCYSEANIARFIQVIPHVPYLRTPSTESLKWASDKYEMRRRFRLYDPKHTPRFALVKNDTKEECDRLIKKVGFPMVVKPTNLATSMLVSICYHREELEQTLKRVFKKITKQYKKSGRIEYPRIIAEEYMDGDMYSIDSYVNSRGDVYHCPIVKVTTGKSVGHDDFYNYIRMTPTGLKPASIKAAEERAEIGIHALGLRSVTTHTELMRVDGDWKIIEIGPRVGGFRHVLHELSCGIDHYLNDILVRIPKKPILPKKCQGFSAVMRFYPDKEGLIEKVTGVKKVQSLASYYDIDINLKTGQRAYYSKNGGKGVFDLTLYNDDRTKLLADMRRVEKMVKIKVK
jgi:biotin carboxylase